jgi:hypothetical protein
MQVCIRFTLSCIQRCTNMSLINVKLDLTVVFLNRTPYYYGTIINLAQNESLV